MQNQNEGKVFGKEVLGLDPEMTDVVEKKVLFYGLSYSWSRLKKPNKPKNIKEKNKTQQVSVPVVESILLTDPLSCLQKNGSSDPIQYLSFMLLFACCLRFEGRSPSVTQGFCGCT